MMNSMASFIHSKNLDIAQYAFDGILVYGDFYEKPELLKDMEDHLNEEFPDLNMTLVMKQHSKAISREYLENLDEIERTSEQETYEYMKVDFEKTHCKIINKSLFISEYGENFNLMNRKNLMDSYEHLHFKDKDLKKYSFIQTWLKDENIRRYNDIDTVPPPLVCPNNIYNLWKPFNLENVTDWVDSDITIFLNHIKILCNHEEQTFYQVDGSNDTISSNQDQNGSLPRSRRMR